MRQRLIGRKRKRRAAELDRIDAQQQVMHDRIADEGHLENIIAATRASRATSAASAFSAARTAVGHLLRAARIHHGVGDAAHQILAEADLRVHGAAGRDDLAGCQVAQVRGDGGGAYVHRQVRSAAREVPARRR